MRNRSFANILIFLALGSAQAAVVTNSQDDGAGSLRAALHEAAANPGSIISFDLPQSDPGYSASTNDWTIRPRTALPALGAGAVLNAETQPGRRPTPRIVLDGTLAAVAVPPADGLTFTASDSTARGFRIVRFPGSGVRFTNGLAGVAHGNKLQACIIGLDASGNIAANALDGVRLEQGAHHNLIGGTTPADRCVISGNGGRGVHLTGANTHGNTLSGCYLGTDETGSAARANSLEGVAILAAASENSIGLAAPGGGNVVSGNGLTGVSIAGVGTRFNVLRGNAIGTNVARTAEVPNAADGVAIYAGATFNNVGDSVEGGGNLISGNGGPGVTISGSGTGSCNVAANSIGTNGAGTAALPNFGVGVAILGTSTECVVGGEVHGLGNVISGNFLHGVEVSGGARAWIGGNLIGLNAAGTAALGNGGSGVSILSASRVTLGSPAANAPRNVISGNTLDGVNVSGAATVELARCFIGTDLAGTAVLPNTFAGVGILGGASAKVGAELAPGGPAQGNLLCGSSGQTGLTVSGAGSSAEAFGNTFRGQGRGIILSNGGSATVRGNEFRQFAFGGIELFGAATSGSFQRNLFDAASRVPINLAGGTEDAQGRTSNDVDDADSGPNGLLNFPVLNSASQQANGTRVQGTYAGLASRTFTLNFYDVGPGGEVASWLGSQSIQTNTGGSTGFDVVLAGLVRAGRRVAATATVDGATSELSLGALVTVVDSDNDGLPDDYEIAHGLNPLDPADAARDADGDGIPDLAEYFAGTDPQSAFSRLQAKFAGTSPSSYQLTFDAVAGRSYAIDYNDDLAAGAWRTLVPLMAAPESLPRVLHLTLAPGNLPPHYFYRVRLLP